jgi:hypothetical protein
MSATDIGTLIVKSPETLGGRPRIAGTRVSVQRIKVSRCVGARMAVDKCDHPRHLLHLGRPQDPTGEAVPQVPSGTLRERRQAPRRGLPHRSGSPINWGKIRHF